MKNICHDIERIAGSPLFRKLDEAGLINRIVLRNIRIKNEFRELRKTKRPFESMRILSERHFLGFDTIYQIVYRRRVT